MMAVIWLFFKKKNKRLINIQCQKAKPTGHAGHLCFSKKQTVVLQASPKQSFPSRVEEEKITWKAKAAAASPSPPPASCLLFLHLGENGLTSHPAELKSVFLSAVKNQIIQAK